jgi:cell division protein FtsI (penicillin-binding protein 3)
VGIVFSLLWLSLWARAYYLQIVMGPEYADRARRQHMTSEVVTGARGNLMDRNGNILAKSVDCRSVYANPPLVRDKQGAAAKLAQALHDSPGRILSLLNEKKQFVWIARKLDYYTAEKIKALHLPGISLESEFERIYPYKHLAGQLLGFVNIDDKGVEGLEKSFDGTLAGRSIIRRVQRDAAGRRLMGRDAGDAGNLRGRDVRLTIDLQIQFFAEEALAESVEKFGAKWGGCMVVDVPGGEILAWAQYPFFDPNNIHAASAAQRRNRIAMDMLEQGSTVKSFLIAAALEEKAVTPATEINCEKGIWKLRNITLHDTHAYSKLTVAKILHVSSNIGAAKIGLKLGASTYHDYLTRLGFGETTGLPLAGEARGILRAAKKWSEVDLANASFGQSFSATLLQMAQAYLCLAGNGERKALRLFSEERERSAAGGVSGRESSSGIYVPAGGADAPLAESGGRKPADRAEQVFSPATTRIVRRMMRDVVEEDGGTGKEARIADLEVGGKTGTAQKASRTGGGYGKERVGSFVGMLPADEPRYLVLVLLDEPDAVQYGGIIAAPVFRHVAAKILAYHGILPDVEAARERDFSGGAAERGDGKGKKREQALADTSSKASQGKTSQAAAPPKAGSSRGSVGPAARGDPPAEHAGSTVPSVLGLSMRNAVEIFAARGIVPVIRGKGGVVVRQSPESGALWPDGAKECTLWLEERTS